MNLRRLEDEAAGLEDDLRRDHAALRETTHDVRRADLNERVVRGEQRLRGIRDEITILRGGVIADETIRGLLADFDVVWSSLSLVERVNILEAIVEKVEYDGAAGTVTMHYHDRGIRALGGHA